MRLFAYRVGGGDSSGKFPPSHGDVLPEVFFSAKNKKYILQTISIGESDPPPPSQNCAQNLVRSAFSVQGGHCRGSGVALLINKTRVMEAGLGAGTGCRVATYHAQAFHLTNIPPKNTPPILTPTKQANNVSNPPQQPNLSPPHT